MAFSLNFVGNSMEEIITQAASFLACIKGVNLASSKTEEEPEPLPEIKEPIKPVLTQKQMEENVANAPKHELPPVPTVEEVRAALKDLRDRKGSKAVKALLNQLGVDSVPALKPEDYLTAIDLAKVEV